jgi:TonB-linked SusC/RagA family outer membrane protein
MNYLSKSQKMNRKQNKIRTLVFGLLCLAGQTLFAQFSASGTVIDEQGEPLIGVSIIVQGTTLGTVTDFDGKFIVECPNQEAVLLFSYVGYTELEQQFTASLGETVITMPTAITQLDEIVVTGLASSVKRSNLANSVARIDAAELTGVTTQPTLDGAMYGKFKGAEIRSNSGAPGGGMSVRLRGVTSIFGDQQPLYIVDGVYIDNSIISSGTNIVSAAAGGGNTSTNQDDASNRIADIDPEDIESIEVLKGASAASMYGSRAAGGVIIITTKRGKPGDSHVSFSQTFGVAQPTRLLGDRGWDEQKVRDVYGDDEAQRFLTNGVQDYEKLLYDNSAFLTTSRLEIYGGTEKTRYMLGGTYKNDDGIVDNTGYEKAAIRLNVSHKFADWFDLDVTSNYINSTADRGFFNNGNTNTTTGYALAFTRPWDNLLPDSEGNYPANPRVGSNVLETVAKVTNRERVNRFIGGATANFKIVTTAKHSLKLGLSAGLDQYTLRTTSIFPQDLTFYQDPSSLGGVSISGNTINTNTNLQASLAHLWNVSNTFTLRSQIGLIQQDFDLNTVITTATGLNGSQTNLDQAAAVSTYQNIEPQQDKGFFGQIEGNWDDKLIVTAGVRGDKSSNNGDANQLYYYPKANAAVNIHEFDFWGGGFVNNFKLRVAYGEAGRFANFPDRFNAYDGTLIQTNSGLETNILRGNTEVGPERQTELEFGTDLGFWNNRIGLDFTYYIKTVDDLLLQQEVPTSTGYIRKVVNAGELQNKGMEIGLLMDVVRAPNFNWNTRLSFWQNTSEITRLDIPAFNLGGFAASLGQYRIQEGKSATQIVGTYNPDDCETGDCSDLDPDGDGFRVYGDAEPDFNLTWSNDMDFGNFTFSFLLHYKSGGQGVNLSTLLYDLSGTTWDYDDTSLDPTGAQVNGDFRTSEWFAGNAGPWIEKTSYLRLREIGLYYTIPKEVFNGSAKLKLGVSARNLINIFDYNSYDPEVSNFGGNVLANSIEVTPFPYARTINFHIKATF